MNMPQEIIWNSTITHFLERIEHCKLLLKENVLKTETENQLLNDLRQFDYSVISTDEIVLLKIEKLKKMDQWIWSSHKSNGYSNSLSNHILNWEKILLTIKHVSGIKGNQRNGNEITYSLVLSQLLIWGKYISFKWTKNQKEVLELLFQNPKGLITSEEVQHLEQSYKDIQNKLKGQGVTTVERKRFLHLFTLDGIKYCQMCFL